MTKLSDIFRFLVAHLLLLLYVCMFVFYLLTFY